MTTSRAPSALPDETESPAAINAPLFRSVVEPVDSDRRRVVLDLGAACGRTVELLSQYQCRLDIADLSDRLDELNAESTPEGLRNTAESLLPANHPETADVVLCWDILNYLNASALTALMSQIAARSRPGTLVHALIVYAATHMPARPGHYVPLKDCSLVSMPFGPDEREAPRYSPDELKQYLPGYTMERAMLLSNGMQEFLFRVGKKN